MDERLEFIEGVFSKSIENHESPLDNLEIADVDYLIDEVKKGRGLEEEKQSYKEALEEIQEYVSSTDFHESYWDVFVINKIITKVLKGEST